MFGIIPFSINNRAMEAVNFFDRFTDNFFNDDFDTSFSQSSNFSAETNETPTAYTIKAQLPGADKKDISLKFENNTATISANINKEINDKNKGYFSRSSQQISKSFYFDNVDKDKIQARFIDGELQVVLPKLNPDPINEKDDSFIEIQ